MSDETLASPSPQASSVPGASERAEKRQSSAASKPAKSRAPKPSSSGRGCEAYRQLAQQYEWNVDTALAVMRAESGCDPNSDNTGLNQDGSNDKGLLQVNSIHVVAGLIGDEERLEPAKNLAAAYAIYLERERLNGNGWSAWSSFNSGSHLKYMPVN